MSPAIQNPNSTYITIQINNKTIDPFIDTGASICLATKSIYEKWDVLEKPLAVQIADGTIHYIKYVKRRIIIKIQHCYFTEHESGLPLVLGNNFLRLHQPFTQTLTHIHLQTWPMTKYNPSFYNDLSNVA